MNNGYAKKRQRKRNRLFFAQGGKCCWCGKTMILDRRYANCNGYATLDHLDEKWSGERGKHSGEQRIVLACRECNRKRDVVRRLEFFAEKVA